MKLDFSKNTDGLIPAVVQDYLTMDVLMLGYIDAAAWEKTQAEGRVTFYSRSKGRLWTKGEESGNYLDVVEFKIDCDRDTVLIKAKPHGPVCHTGSDTCFGDKRKGKADFLKSLESVIVQRKEGADASESYVASLFNSGIQKIAQKVGEEAVELVLESKDGKDEDFLNEAADLLFHYLVLLQARDKSLEDVSLVLQRRHKQ
ncbi:MAG: bifunctional phosphoribosyl-AMP cyclohydrolase/phosphoribosyl-ATP diphosphatase HisIE [Flavobacteriaceae bacterium]|nr:bifunctional phosphoribosyl-AMP cyclohydrolase/phosphoribosyl-ATP diphosphatase HisIE [Flavobacteriaceae bacterium]